jgi:hypothetical protein
MPSTRSRMPPPACAASMSNSSPSCRVGRWRRWLPPIRRCAASRSSLP